MNRREPALQNFGKNTLRGILCGAHYTCMDTWHPSDETLELYSLRRFCDSPDLAQLEEHLLWCISCIERAEEFDEWTQFTRAALGTLNDIRPECQ